MNDGSEVRARAGLIARAAERLAGRALNPRHEAERLFAHALGLASRTELYLRTITASPEAIRSFERLVGERAAGTPMAYLLGYAEFYNDRFLVSRGVFIPRPETEILVTTSLEAWGGEREREGTLLELGVGSGAVVVSLLRELPAAKGIGVDLSEAAILCAAENAHRLGVENRLYLHCGDLFAPLSGARGPALRSGGRPFDLIVANPPYVAAHESLPDEVRGFEPEEALFGGASGLEVIRRIAFEAPDWLRPGGALVLEIGESQAHDVTGIVQQRGEYGAVKVIRDLAGKERVVMTWRRT